MSTATDIKHIVRDPDVYGGKPSIEGHRIAVHDIALTQNQGYSPEQMVTERYPTQECTAPSQHRHAASPATHDLITDEQESNWRSA
ncbi:MAG: hypothetical protein OJF49_001970 [Ktedonobacterales bacterium]|jgi:uncharacterized protein (DUF433 family)|nr:MAG: hypothetical protein OJF49_001970 [Ktedonobacterales bacterium]